MVRDLLQVSVDLQHSEGSLEHHHLAAEEVRKPFLLLNYKQSLTVLNSAARISSWRLPTTRFPRTRSTTRLRSSKKIEKTALSRMQYGISVKQDIGKEKLSTVTASGEFGFIPKIETCSIDNTTMQMNAT